MLAYNSNIRSSSSSSSSSSHLMLNKSDRSSNSLSRQLTVSCRYHGINVGGGSSSSSRCLGSLLAPPARRPRAGPWTGQLALQGLLGLGSSQLQQLQTVVAAAAAPVTVSSESGSEKPLRGSASDSSYDEAVDNNPLVLPWKSFRKMPQAAHVAILPEGPKHLVVHLDGMTAVLHARAAAKQRGIPLKRLAARWEEMRFPEMSWRDVPSADEYARTVVSKYSYQRRSQRRGYEREATIVGFQWNDLPMFSKQIRQGWQTVGDVAAAESQFLSTTLTARGISAAVVFRVRRWPTQSEARGVVESLCVGGEYSGARWFDAESRLTGAGPIVWNGKEYSSGMLRIIN